MEDRTNQTVPADPVDVCAACGQLVLTTPDDPMPTLLCDVCLASVERRRELRRANAALNQRGLFS
jgi:hypothetical protein